jgi:hypothetical protein
MHIEEFLEKRSGGGKNYLAGFTSIDLIDSSRLQGTPEDITRTKDALKGLIESLIHDQPIAILSWRGDGGILICDGSQGFDHLVFTCDELIHLLPLFNDSPGRLNFLSNDRIHLRVVCHGGRVNYTGKPDILHADALNQVAKREREVGVVDHVVVTDDIYKGLSEDYKRRFVSAEDIDPVLGAHFILDRDQASATIQLNTHTSENIRDWIAESARQKQYDELYLISYTNQTLFEFLSSPIPTLKIRILARSWLAEEDDERIYNKELAKRKKFQQKFEQLRQPWMKSRIIRSVAEMMVDPDVPRPFKNEIDIRFYDSPPWLKGAMLRNSKSGRRAALIGFYSWNPRPIEGGSPYIGEHWSGVWLSDDDGPQTNMLDVIQSRFDELWNSGSDYTQMKEQELARNAELPHKIDIENIWNLDGQPYLIIVPGRHENKRFYPAVAGEDLMAMRAIEQFLGENGADVDMEIVVDSEYSQKIRDWEGHLVYICHRTLSDELLDELYQSGWSYKILRHPQASMTIKHTVYDQSFQSPMDREQPERMDFCLIVKMNRPEKVGKLFVIAGIHAIGTWGGACYLTDTHHLNRLSTLIEEDNFSTLIQCEFDQLLRIQKVKDVMSPEILSKELHVVE